MQTISNGVVPGEYVGRKDNIRSVIAVPVRGMCIFAHGSAASFLSGDVTGAGDSRLIVSTCSVRTLRKATSDTPRRVFTPTEVHKLAERMDIGRSRGRCNHLQQALFHSDVGKAAIAASLPPVPKTAPSVVQESPAARTPHVAEPGIGTRLFNGVKHMLSGNGATA